MMGLRFFAGCLFLFSIRMFAMTNFSIFANLSITKRTDVGEKEKTPPGGNYTVPFSPICFLRDI